MLLGRTRTDSHDDSDGGVQSAAAKENTTHVGPDMLRSSAMDVEELYQEVAMCSDYDMSKWKG